MSSFAAGGGRSSAAIRHGRTEYGVSVHEQRFWSRVSKPAGTSCWIWTGKPKPNGYGQIHMGPGRGSMQAHCVSYLLHRGVIPEGCQVLHSCDNRACVNPDHLSLGTHHDNMADMVAKDRQAKKLTAEQVSVIRRSELTEREIAPMFCISRSHVGALRRGERRIYKRQGGGHGEVDTSAES
jgi:hypothetical protein